MIKVLEKSFSKISTGPSRITQNVFLVLLQRCFKKAWIQSSAIMSYVMKAKNFKL